MAMMMMMIIMMPIRLPTNYYIKMCEKKIFRFRFFLYSNVRKKNENSFIIPDSNHSWQIIWFPFKKNFTIQLFNDLWKAFNLKSSTLNTVVIFFTKLFRLISWLVFFPKFLLKWQKIISLNNDPNTFRILFVFMIKERIMIIIIISFSSI